MRLAKLEKNALKLSTALRPPKSFLFQCLRLKRFTFSLCSHVLWTNFSIAAEAIECYSK